MAVLRFFLTAVAIGVVSTALYSQDPLPPDAEAILNPPQSPEADGSLPALEELTAPPSSPPIFFETTSKPPTPTEVAGLPEQPAEQTPQTEEAQVQPTNDLAETESQLDKTTATDSPGEQEITKENPAPTESVSATGPQPTPTTLTSVSARRLGILFSGVVAFLLPVGFALIASGSTRAKNVGHTMTMCVAGSLAATAAYAFIGFGLQMGGVFAPESASRIVLCDGETTALQKPLGVTIAETRQTVVGCAGFVLAGLTEFDLTLFVRESALVAAFVAILGGALAERIKLSAFVALALFCGAAIHPINAAACWGGGWVAALGRNYGLGQGVIDSGGSIYLHLASAVGGMIGILFLGARYGKYNKDGSLNPIPGHNALNVLAGTSLLFVGWLGLAAGSALMEALGPAAAVCAVLITGGTGLIAGLLISFLLLKKIDPYLLCSATIAGWVSGSACWGRIPMWGFAALGFLSGAFVIFALLLIERRLRFDDPTGVLAVHGVSGLIGSLAPGIFMLGGATSASPSAQSAVSGPIYANSGQLLAQCAGVVATVVTVSLLSSICLLCIRLVIGLRADLRDEVAGLDLPELGALGYQPDLNPEPKLRPKK